MTATYEHPSLKMHVTPEQRDRAEDWLKDAYADGRISESEFDSRIGQVLSAGTRGELNSAFYGLVHVPSASTAMGLHPAYQPLVRPEARDRAGNGVAALAHFSTFFVWLLGPALIYALSSPGTRARREAAKAFNFTLVTFFGLLGSSIAGGITNLDIFDLVSGLIFVGWVVLTVVGGAKAAQGENWKNPVRHVARLQVLSEK
ncbi:DUF1707 and DUF4870 domain-containing protein [uncultured Friedmanniella sp.]|uniref:DUF1707 and DUF4870 domain-containing protein n=1 Tax=uncultured Friedmanniella sp. TaxID=335381 RepID=UPI0035CB6823